MAPNTATAGKSYAQKAADLFMTAVGMKSATKPEPKEDAFAEEKATCISRPRRSDQNTEVNNER